MLIIRTHATVVLAIATPVYPLLPLLNFKKTYKLL